MIWKEPVSLEWKTGWQWCSLHLPVGNKAGAEGKQVLVAPTPVFSTQVVTCGRPNLPPRRIVSSPVTLWSSSPSDVWSEAAAPLR